MHYTSANSPYTWIKGNSTQPQGGGYTYDYTHVPTDNAPPSLDGGICWLLQTGRHKRM